MSSVNAVRTWLFVCLLVLAGCETPEQKQARETQFDGQSLQAVIDVIGEPNRRSSSQAVWTFKTSFVNRYPIQHVINGKLVTLGYRSENVTLDCIYTADLKAGRVVKSTYEGNSCEKFAPKQA